jgi:hypothetical protein
MLRPVARTIVPKLIVSTRASSLLFVARDRIDGSADVHGLESAMLRPVARTIVPKLIVSTRASSLLFVARDRIDAAFPTLLGVAGGEPCAEPCAEPREEPRDGEWFRVGTSSSSAIKISYSWLVQDSATDSGAEPC